MLYWCNSMCTLRLIYKYKYNIFKKHVAFVYKVVKAHEPFNNKVKERTIGNVMALFSNLRD